MRILGIGQTLDLGSMYLHLIDRGHEVRVFVGDEAAHGTLEGLVPTTDDWRRELGWVRAAGSDGLLLFETASQGELQDQLRADGFQVIGGSAFGDRLEGDRAFGQTIMQRVGMQVAESRSFDDFEQAIACVRARPRRYVYKLSGKDFASGRTFIGELGDGADMLAYLRLQQRHFPADESVRILLMDRIDGIEVGVGAYFDGRRFLQPACLDWEHKRFFPGDLGELTGEMGTLVTYRRSERLFAETLGRMEAALRDGGYCGYVNVNTIVNDAGVHPLELTCRFGYPGFAILQPLQRCGWDELFCRMLDRTADRRFPTEDGFAIGVVLTVPPFPYAAGYDRLSKGLPVILRPDLDAEDRAHLHFCEVAMSDGELVTSGMVGYTMVVTGCGPTVAAARAAAYGRIAKVCLPRGRYRLDIGERFMRNDERALQALGWL